MHNNRGQNQESSARGEGVDRKHRTGKDSTLMRTINQYQARGSMLSQMGRVLTKEDQDRAREEVLAYKFF